MIFVLLESTGIPYNTRAVGNSGEMQKWQ